MSNRNIVLITVDCLRPDHMGTYGYHRETTPAIDSIANEGTVFSEAYSNGPGTRWAMKSLCAGIYPLQIQGVGLPNSGITTLAEQLNDHGYNTGCFALNGFVSKDFNYHRGFDKFTDITSLKQETEAEKQAMFKIQDIAKKIGSNINNRKVYNFLDSAYKNFLNKAEKHGIEPSITDSEITEEAKDWINNKNNENKPFFAWIHLIDAHAPYQFKPSILSEIGISPENINPVRTPGNNYDLEVGSSPPQNLIDMYDMNVRLSDNSIQKVIDDLPDSTDLIISADHGEEFGFHTGFHSVSAFDTMARIPLIIRSPQLKKNNVKSPVALVDIPPTVCSMAGIPNVDDWVGVDLCSDLPPGRDIFIEFDEPNQITASVVRGDLKYVTRRRSINEDPADEYLFDRSEDECETKNIVKSSEYSSDVEDLCYTLEAHLDWVSENRMSTPYGIWEPNSGMTGERMNQVNDSIQEQLESLGYIN